MHVSHIVCDQWGGGWHLSFLSCSLIVCFSAFFSFTAWPGFWWYLSSCIFTFNEVSGGTRMELNIIYTCETAGVEDFKFVPMETSNTVLCKWFSQVYTFTIFPFSCSFFKWSKSMWRSHIVTELYILNTQRQRHGVHKILSVQKLISFTSDIKIFKSKTFKEQVYQKLFGIWSLHFCCDSGSPAGETISLVCQLFNKLDCSDSITWSKINFNSNTNK